MANRKHDTPKTFPSNDTKKTRSSSKMTPRSVLPSGSPAERGGLHALLQLVHVAEEGGSSPRPRLSTVGVHADTMENMTIMKHWNQTSETNKYNYVFDGKPRAEEQN